VDSAGPKSIVCEPVLAVKANPVKFTAPVSPGPVAIAAVISADWPGWGPTFEYLFSALFKPEQSETTTHTEA
jgi:hypothetical protein